MYHLCRKELAFTKTQHLHNAWNDNKPVKIGRDGQVEFKFFFVSTAYGEVISSPLFFTLNVCFCCRKWNPDVEKLCVKCFHPMKMWISLLLQEKLANLLVLEVDIIKRSQKEEIVGVFAGDMISLG